MRSVAPVAGERAENAHYFRSVADYIHLNPARAGLTGGGRDRLVDYPRSSLRHYPKGHAPDWQPMDRVLEAFRLSHDRRGRAAYVSWLEARAERSTRRRWRRFVAAGISRSRASKTSSSS